MYLSLDFELLEGRDPSPMAPCTSVSPLVTVSCWTEGKAEGMGDGGSQEGRKAGREGRKKADQREGDPYIFVKATLLEKRFLLPEGRPDKHSLLMWIIQILSEGGIPKPDAFTKRSVGHVALHPRMCEEC